MREIRIRKRTNHHTREEAITNNLKTMGTLEKAALNAVNGAIDGLRNSKTLRDDIRTGKKEITIIDDGGPLIVKDDYCTYICNERKKSCRKGTQEQIILEYLCREKINGGDGMLSIGRLVAILSSKWASLSADRVSINKTVTAARDRLNNFFGFNLIKSSKGKYWIDYVIKK